MTGSTELPGESEFILGSITTPPTPLKDSSTFLPTSTPTTPKKDATTFIVTPTKDKEQFLPEKYLRGMYKGGRGWRVWGRGGLQIVLPDGL